MFLKNTNAIQFKQDYFWFWIQNLMWILYLALWEHDVTKTIKEWVLRFMECIFQSWFVILYDWIKYYIMNQICLVSVVWFVILMNERERRSLVAASFCYCVWEDERVVRCARERRGAECVLVCILHVGFWVTTINLWSTSAHNFYFFKKEKEVEETVRRKRNFKALFYFLFIIKFKS